MKSLICETDKKLDQYYIVTDNNNLYNFVQICTILIEVKKKKINKTAGCKTCF